MLSSRHWSLYTRLSNVVGMDIITHIKIFSACICICFASLVGFWAYCGPTEVKPRDRWRRRRLPADGQRRVLCTCNSCVCENASKNPTRSSANTHNNLPFVYAIVDGNKSICVILHTYHHTSHITSRPSDMSARRPFAQRNQHVVIAFLVQCRALSVVFFLVDSYCCSIRLMVSSQCCRQRGGIDWPILRDVCPNTFMLIKFVNFHVCGAHMINISVCFSAEQLPPNTRQYARSFVCFWGNRDDRGKKRNVGLVYYCFDRYRLPTYMGEMHKTCLCRNSIPETVLSLTYIAE